MFVGHWRRAVWMSALSRTFPARKRHVWRDDDKRVLHRRFMAAASEDPWQLDAQDHLVQIDMAETDQAYQDFVRASPTRVRAIDLLASRRDL